MMTVGDAPASVVVSSEQKEEKRRDEVVVEMRRDLQSESEGKKACRICHLRREIAGSSAKGPEAILIGCGCKGELGFAHQDCGKAWFKARGNRQCEICGKYAENINGDENRSSSFMEEWSGESTLDSSTTGHASERVSCWRSRPLCNLLVGTLVLVSVYLWFFRKELS